MIYVMILDPYSNSVLRMDIPQVSNQLFCKHFFINIDTIYGRTFIHFQYSLPYFLLLVKTNLRFLISVLLYGINLDSHFLLNFTSELCMCSYFLVPCKPCSTHTGFSLTDFNEKTSPFLFQTCYPT